MNPPSLKRPIREIQRQENDRWGFDHNGWVLELQPEPSQSCRELIKRMRQIMRSIYTKAFQNDTWLSSAMVQSPERTVTLGGHVHLDIWFEDFTVAVPTLSALDRFNAGLEHLDILPREGCQQRRTLSHYGRPSDVRWDHRRLEYRSMPSWLFSRKTALLSLAGAKFAVLAPEEVPTITSIPVLRKFIEKFKGKDADADWMLNRGYFSRPLTAQPNANLTTAWRLEEA